MNVRWPLALALWLLSGLLVACRGSAPPSGGSPAPPSAAPSPEIPNEDEPPAGAVAEFNTDFRLHSVPLSEFLSGGPPKDGIPALDAPQFVSVSEAERWLAPREPVVLFTLDGEARAYPIQILIWHEIVNDVVAGRPVLITFCPLCNTAIAFDRTVEGKVLDFGTTGRLRFSNLVMYDRQTETWWQQATGEALVGTLTGRRLTPLPASIVAWETFRERYPEGQVLSRETGYSRPYGRNPYAGYDSVDSFPFLYRGPTTPEQLPPLARVLTLEQGDEAVAYPYDALTQIRVVNDTVGGTPVVVFWVPGVASPLDTGDTATGRDVGTALAYDRRLEGRTLTFRWDGTTFRDRETNSTWTALGEATAGPLAGSRLTRLPAINHFWFSWAAFRPDARLFQPEGTP